MPSVPRMSDRAIPAAFRRAFTVARQFFANSVQQPADAIAAARLGAQVHESPPVERPLLHEAEPDALRRLRQAYGRHADPRGVAAFLELEDQVAAVHTVMMELFVHVREVDLVGLVARVAGEVQDAGRRDVLLGAFHSLSREHLLVAATAEQQLRERGHGELANLLQQQQVGLTNANIVASLLRFPSDDVAAHTRPIALEPSNGGESLPSVSALRQGLVAQAFNPWATTHVNALVREITNIKNTEARSALLAAVVQASEVAQGLTVWLDRSSQSHSGALSPFHAHLQELRSAARAAEGHLNG
ncbi:MAG: hypothetical protein ACKVPX_14795 [Myxococcaceae bacterium]